MNIHESAAVGDLDKMRKAVARGESINAWDDQGLTPLMVAAGSSTATVETLRGMIELGADVNGVAKVIPPPSIDAEQIATLKEQMAEMGLDASYLDQMANVTSRPASVDSVLSHAIKNGTLAKIQLLLEGGADAKYVDAAGYGEILNAVYRGPARGSVETCQLISLLFEAGAPLNVESSYGEFPICVAADHGNREVVRHLIRLGADPAPLQWNDLFHAILDQDLFAVRTLAKNRELLATSDCCSRTPFLLACQLGEVDISNELFRAGSDLHVKGRCGKTALLFAIESKQPEMVEWLIERGVDIAETDEFGSLPLNVAAQVGPAETVRLLLNSGADPSHCDKYNHSAMRSASTSDVIALLADHGCSLSDVQPEMRQLLVGHAGRKKLEFDPDECQDYKHRRFGDQNPERMNNPYWDDMVRTRVSAYPAAVRFGESGICRPPYWCFQRFGHSMTRLPDGRYIEIAGEHEDHYDPDFCIYNDVVVHHGDGTFDIYGYPEDVFPPTDFHTATLIGDAIYIIGSLGYVDSRQPGVTPVYRLDTKSFSIERFECSGPAPGWINRHSARIVDGDQIEIRGGDVLVDDDFQTNDDVYRLNVNRRWWHRAQH